MKKNLQKIILGIGVGGGAAVIGGFLYLYYNGLSGCYTNTKPKEGQIKVACVGDSITYGHGIRNWKKNSYPAILQKLLGEKYHVANFGSSGSCVNPNGNQPYCKRAIYKESLKYNADILIFMLGTNDSKPENWVDMEYFMQSYMDLLGTYLKSKNPPKVYIGICSKAYFRKKSKTGVAGFDIQPAIVNEIAKNLKLTFKSVSANLGKMCVVLARQNVSAPLCHLREALSWNDRFTSKQIYENAPLVENSFFKTTNCGCPYSVIDIHALTEAHPEWFATDGIHPNNDGAKAIAEAVAGAVKKFKSTKADLGGRRIMLCTTDSSAPLCHPPDAYFT